MHNVAGE